MAVATIASMAVHQILSLKLHLPYILFEVLNKFELRVVLLLFVQLLLSLFIVVDHP
jgi:hypothetical protein